jgi:hypothetical protein
MSVPNGTFQAVRESMISQLLLLSSIIGTPGRCYLLTSKLHRTSGAIIGSICHLDDVGPTNLHVERLHAISAIGKKWRACYALKGSGGEVGRPVRGIAVKSSLKGEGPECWNPDITSDASWEALRRIVATVKGYVHQ